MLRQPLSMLRTALVTALIAALAPPAAATERVDDAPATREAAAPHPGAAERDFKPRTPPSLSAATAREFVDFAAASRVDEQEAVRAALMRSAREAQSVVPALCEEAKASSREDPQRSLIALALVGELRSPAGAACLREVLQCPLPTEGTRIDGELVESVTLEMQQAKAVDGLAYLRGRDTDEEVLRIAGSHPSRIVRAEAIAAFLWNQRDARAARERLARVVRPEERLFLDRPTRVAGEKAEAFNARLQAYLRLHPEVVAPAPEKRKEPRPKDAEQRSEPPAF